MALFSMVPHWDVEKFGIFDLGSFISAVLVQIGPNVVRQVNTKMVRWAARD